MAFSYVIPAKAGIQETQWGMDSASPLRCGRNDDGLIVVVIFLPHLMTLHANILCQGQAMPVILVSTF